MATETVTATTELRLASPSGIVTRKILRTPLRDALPSEIPIIDISPIFSSSLEERQAVAQQVRAAAQNMGFFYIKNHGIPEDAIQDVYEAGLEFFRQDLETKMRADSSGTRWDKGYQGPNTQRLNPVESVDLRESFSYQYDPRYDDTVGEDGIGNIPEEAREYLAWEDDYPWEQTRNLPRLKESMMRHMGECLRLARALTRCFALSLGLEEGLFDEKVRYPEKDVGKNEEEEDKKVSIGSHTDFQLFTILWQDLHGGLEVLNKEGQWLRAKPIEGTLVVNLGDCMQRITNDEYTSTVHRARNYSGKERVSIPVFWGFGLHETCSVVVGGEKKKYEDVKCADWIMMRIRGMKQLE
ncbi:2OG-Fe(II) oxygenase superfamily domain-containing protein [Trichoderma breve]|uniref:2OG-Fe(II) oxygenase superfamily domain-containing protein n=1 Tax=Trichoderma breve TaxID=2034170 RepID=A0A9W9BAE2_9HYPO|nr:2OG-Fe(II) oxygenase superfamily domain-containing protein [Trichoderma breve]KAJ4859613.1 2OG-Fe(II) oxygenase superfamily domain-containing protein [Trichoderma breve]